MTIIGTIIVYLIMACALIGALSSVFDENSHLGNEFLNGWKLWKFECFLRFSKRADSLFQASSI